MKVIVGLAAAALAASVTLQPAAARDGWSPGAAAAVGVLGGLAAGTAIGSAASQPPYYPGRPVGYGPPPPPAYLPPPPRRVYYEDDAPACYVKRRRYVDEYGDVIIRRERVCE